MDSVIQRMEERYGVKFRVFPMWGDELLLTINGYELITASPLTIGRIIGMFDTYFRSLDNPRIGGLWVDEGGNE